MYGVLAVATVIAAESTRQETLPKLAAASAITVGLYWLAHGYSQHWGARAKGEAHWTPGHFLQSLVEESSILVGSALPAFVLLIAWGAGATVEAAVTAVLWSAGVELVALEMVVGIRRHLGFRDTAVQTLIGVLLALGIFAVRIVLH